MVQISTAAVNASLDALETAAGTAPVLELRTGVPETNAAAAATGTLLASFALPTDWMANAANRIKSKLGTWSGAASAAGYVGHYRIRDTQATPVVHLQGPCSEPWGASKAYVVGQQVHNGGLVYRATAAGTSASSGGPTGTGASITDGGVTWAYVAPVEMTFDNTNFNSGQTVTVNQYDLTGPAA